MNDIQAALGLSQMKRLDNYIKIRHKIAKVYDENFLIYQSKHLGNYQNIIQVIICILFVLKKI